MTSIIHLFNAIQLRRGTWRLARVAFVHRATEDISRTARAPSITLIAPALHRANEKKRTSKHAAQHADRIEDRVESHASHVCVWGGGTEGAETRQR